MNSHRSKAKLKSTRKPVIVKRSRVQIAENPQQPVRKLSRSQNISQKLTS